MGGVGAGGEAPHAPAAAASCLPPPWRGGAAPRAQRLGPPEVGGDRAEIAEISEIAGDAPEIAGGAPRGVAAAASWLSSASGGWLSPPASRGLVMSRVSGGRMRRTWLG